MFFNSIKFIGFYFLVLIILWIINKSGRSLKARNITLLLASYYFYGYFNIGFLIILLYVTIINFFAGSCILNNKIKGRKGILTGCIILTLLPLIYYKYAFFLLNNIVGLFNIETNLLTIEGLVLPVGISFFTFQALSYTIDVYRDKIKEKYKFLDFALFVSFFPTILSGPIEKARNLLPQIRRYYFTNIDSLLQGGVIFIWGLFKKVVIADRLAAYVDWAYNGVSYLTGTTIALAIVFYSIQIYCDFSGYSDMALGVAKGLGFNITKNFEQPYISRTIKDFWHKWHISLTSWFTEYVYFSLGGNRVKYKAHWILNISLIFILSGIWHGAAWNFLIWGLIHAIYYIFEYLVGLQNKNCKWNSFTSFISGIWVFFVASVAWVFFRATTFNEAILYLTKAFTDYGRISFGASTFTFVLTISMLLIFVIYEILIRFKVLNYDTENYNRRLNTNIILTLPLIIFIALCGMDSENFVYFQF